MVYRRMLALTSGLGVLAVAVSAGAQTVIYSTGSILHTSNLGTTPAVRSTGPYAGCRVEYNGDNTLNPDDLGDFITDYFTFAPIAGPGGYATPCPSEPVPYNNGYKCNYTSDGSPQCSPPFPDNLGDYITDYFSGCAPLPVISPPNYTSDVQTLNTPLQLPFDAMIVSPGGPNTTAKAGLSTLSKPGALGIVFAAGTSLTQARNPSTNASTASTLTISFETAWQLTSTLGPAVKAGAALTLLGSLPPNPVPMGGCPPGGRFARMDLEADFHYSIPGGASGFMRPPIASSPFGSIVTSCGPYSLAASDYVGASPMSFPAGTTITIKGTLTLSLHNDPLGEAGIDAAVFTLEFAPPPPICPADFNRNGVVNDMDSQNFQNAYINLTPGPGGYAVPCPAELPPFDAGYQADFDGDCSITPDDLGGFLTAFGTQCGPTYCPADFNLDGAVNPVDEALFENAFLTSIPGPGGYAVPCPGLAPPFNQGYQADFNGDCAADLNDLVQFDFAFNQACDPIYCRADFNRDGVVNVMDLGLFHHAYTYGTLGPGGYAADETGYQADFNQDGSLDPDDLSDFLTQYNGGC
ncbi:MAG: hypothetical protein ACKVS8_02085 [Phycisphaerales bacterium]